LKSVDAVVTDPPYGIKEARGKNKSRGKLATSKDYGDASWDDSPAELWMIDQLLSMSRYAIVWGGNYYQLPPSSCWLVWDKDNGKTDFADCELAWTNLKTAVRKFKWRWQGMLQEEMGEKKERRYHPTQKPIPLMGWCLDQLPSDAEKILDPYMGAGSTLIAAARNNTSVVGVEMSEEYCEIAIMRIELDLNQPLTRRDKY